MAIIQLKRSNTPGNLVTSLLEGEVAINQADGILFTRKTTGGVRKTYLDNITTFTRSTFTASDNTGTPDQKIFTIPGGYTPGLVWVSVNGQLLNGTEFNAAGGTTVTISTPKLNSLTTDTVEIISMKGNTIANLAPLVHVHNASDISGLSTVGKTGSASDLSSGTLSKLRFPLSGATAGVYGSNTRVPVITVDDKGIISSITSVPASGGGTGTGTSTGNVSIVGTAVVNNVAVFSDVAGNIKDGGTLAVVAKSGSAADLTTGRLLADRLPIPTATTMGGVQANVGTAGQVVTGIDATTGALTFTTPSVADKSVTMAKLADVIGPGLIGRTTASTGVPSLNTLSAYMDSIVSSPGAVLGRGAAGWVSSGIGTTGQVLMANPGGAPVFADNVPNDAAWTPFTPSFYQQAGALSGPVATGRYSKQGRTVKVSYKLTCTGIGSGSGVTFVTLPFASAGDVVIGGSEFTVHGLVCILRSYSGSTTVCALTTYANATAISGYSGTLTFEFNGIYESAV